MRSKLLTAVVILAACVPAQASAEWWDDVGEFASIGVKRLLGLDASTHACDSIGVQKFQKKAFSEAFECEAYSDASMRRLIGGRLGLYRTNDDVNTFMRRGVLTLVGNDYYDALARKIEYLKGLHEQFRDCAMSMDGCGKLKSDAAQQGVAAMDVINRLLIPGAKVFKKDSKEFNQLLDVAASVSPLLGLYRDNLYDAAAKAQEFGPIETSMLLSSATSTAIGFVQAEMSKTRRELDALSDGELSGEREHELVKKLIINNPVRTAALIDGIKMTATGTIYEPTPYAVMSRGLCELESRFYEYESYAVQDDFFKQAAMTPLAFMGGGLGAMYMLGHSLYTLGKDVPAAFKQCEKLKESFQVENAIMLDEALHMSPDEMGTPLTPAQAQAAALSECTRQASLNAGMAIVNVGLAAAGLGAASKNVSSLFRVSQKSAQQMALWGGRGIGAVSVGLSTRAMVQACYGEKVDEEQCRVSKLQLAEAGVVLVGNEINMAQRKRALKNSQNDYSNMTDGDRAALQSETLLAHAKEVNAKLPDEIPAKFKETNLEAAKAIGKLAGPEKRLPRELLPSSKNKAAAVETVWRKLHDPVALGKWIAELRAEVGLEMMRSGNPKTKEMLAKGELNRRELLVVLVRRAQAVGYDRFRSIPKGCCTPTQWEEVLASGELFFDRAFWDDPHGVDVHILQMLYVAPEASAAYGAPMPNFVRNTMTGPQGGRMWDALFDSMSPCRTCFNRPEHFNNAVGKYLGNW